MKGQCVHTDRMRKRHFRVTSVIVYNHLDEFLKLRQGDELGVLSFLLFGILHYFPVKLLSRLRGEEKLFKSMG